MKKTNEIELGFIDSVLKTYCVILLFFCPFGIYYLGLFQTFSVISAGIWSMINLMLIRALVKSTLHHDGPNAGRAIAFAFIKFPLLYLTGYFLLKVPHFDTVYLLFGFSGLLATIMLKLVARAFFETNKPVHRKHESRRMSAA